MNKSILMLSAACMLIVASCSKNKTEPEQETTCKVKLVEHVHNGGTDKYYYSYDSEGRITRVDYGTAQSTEFETFTYASNTVTWNGGGDTEVYNLDANGRVTSANQGSDVLNFKYNTEGQLIETGIGSDIETFTYLNGNLSTANYGSSPWSIFTYGSEFSSNAIVYSWVYQDKFLDFDEISGRVIPFIGKKSNNLPNKIITNPGVDQTTNDYTYIKDATGNITSVQVAITEAPNVKSTEIYRFTYDCK